MRWPAVCPINGVDDFWTGRHVSVFVRWPKLREYTLLKFLLITFVQCNVTRHLCNMGDKKKQGSPLSLP